MNQSLSKWIRNTSRAAVNSIAFLPACISVGFLLLAYVMIQFDFSDSGKAFKASLDWLSLKDASTARSICSSIAGGIISLAVFSFSMVMILLNQAASQMSNRILGNLIGNRFQQTVLGFYIGTIVYALFLLSTIRDVNTGIYVPAISTYLLIALTVADIFLFIYFLHYVTQTVKFEIIIKRISKRTEVGLKDTSKPNELPLSFDKPANRIAIGAYRSGLFQGFDKEDMLRFCVKEDVVIELGVKIGDYVLKGNPLLFLYTKNTLQDDFFKKISQLIEISMSRDIDLDSYYGFKQLMEIALKALSPGINDPETGVLALQSIGNLLFCKLESPSEVYVKDKDNMVRIYVRDKSFENLFEECIMPIWDYGKKDRLIQTEMINLLKQLQMKTEKPIVSMMLAMVEAAEKPTTF
ncbi:putative membrane protein [Pedobacter sp. UYEF25]